MIYWANPERIGVIIMRDKIPFYVDSGPEYEEAVKNGPLPFVEDYSPLTEETTSASQPQ